MAGYPYCEAVYRGQNIVHPKLQAHILQNPRIIRDKSKPLDFAECLYVLKDNWEKFNLSKNNYIGVQWLQGVAIA